MNEQSGFTKYMKRWGACGGCEKILIVASMDRGENLTNEKASMSLWTQTSHPQRPHKCKRRSPYNAKSTTLHSAFSFWLSPWLLILTNHTFFWHCRCSSSHNSLRRITHPSPIHPTFCWSPLSYMTHCKIDFTYASHCVSKNLTPRRMLKTSFLISEIIWLEQ